MIPNLTWNSPEFTSWAALTNPDAEWNLAILQLTDPLSLGLGEMSQVGILSLVLATDSLGVQFAEGRALLIGLSSSDSILPVLGEIAQVLGIDPPITIIGSDELQISLGETGLAVVNILSPTGDTISLHLTEVSSHMLINWVQEDGLPTSGVWVKEAELPT